MTSIFDEENKVAGGNFFKFKQIGDKIEGTLVGKRSGFNQLKGEDQMIYKIKVADGSYWNVGGKYGIDLQMQNVRLGQIVGFEFVEIRPSKKPGMNPTHIIQVYANAKVVDEEWIKEQEELSGEIENNEIVTKNPATSANPTVSSPVDELVGAVKDLPFHTKDEKTKMLECITQLAQDKLGAANAEDVKQKVMEATGLAFIDKNLLSIIESLSEMPTRK